MQQLCKFCNSDNVLKFVFLPRTQVIGNDLLSLKFLQVKFVKLLECEQLILHFRTTSPTFTLAA